jgi:hypothetical protein
MLKRSFLFLLLAGSAAAQNTPPAASGGGAAAIACVASPGNTTGSYRQQCQTSGGALYVCNNSGGCTVAADWVAVGSGAGQYQVVPSLLTSETGAGTEASPWANADNTAGIQAAVNTLAAVRGGQVVLSPGRFNVASTISITTPSIVLAGVSKGYNQDPNGIAEGVWGTKLKWTGASAGVVISAGSSSPRPGFITIRDTYIYGHSTVPSGTDFAADTCISTPTWTDQFRLENSLLTNCGVGLHLGSASSDSTDSATIWNTDFQGLGIGIYCGNHRECGDLLLSDDQFSDNSAQAIWLDGVSTFGEEHPTIANPRIYDGCYNASCTTYLASVVNFRPYLAWSGGTVQYPGRSYDHGSQQTADGIYQGGDYGTFTGGNVQHSLGCGIRLLGNYNDVSGWEFLGNATDVCISGSTNRVSSDTLLTATIGGNGNVLVAPNASSVTISGNDNVLTVSATVGVTDTGLRNVINGVSKNAGDPATAGNWNGVSKRVGLQIWDTTNNNLYTYTSATARTVQSVTLTGYYGVYYERQSLTIASAQVTGTLPNDEPLLVTLSDTTLKTVANGGQVQNASGYDIVFSSDAPGNVPLCAIKLAYSASAGTASFRVRVPSAAVGTTIYAFWGDSAITSNQGNSCTAASAFPVAWKEFYPFNADGADLTGTNSATIYGSPTFGAGVVGNAATFASPSTTNYILGGTTGIPTGTSAKSIAGWIDLTSAGATRVPFGWIGSGASESTFGFYTDNSGGLYVWTAITNFSCGQTLATSTPYFVAATWDGGTTLKCYVNAGAAASTTGIALNTSSVAYNVIGKDANGNAFPWSGYVDEVRGYAGTWTAAEVAAFYNNEHAPGTFWSAGTPTH